MSYDIESDTPVNTDKEVPGFGQASSYSSNSHEGSLSNPFSTSMNHVFFSGADRRILLDEVIHLCQFGNNLVAVVGDDGVGKTAFLNQARFELAETAFCCFINAGQLTTPEDVFSHIVSQLELPVSSISSAGEMIATLRHAMAEGSMHRVVVIIDDAHQLNDTILSALISLLQGHQGQHLHILMGGEKDLVNRLDHFEMVDVLVYDVTLNPFTQEETQEYLEFKLTTAGYANENFLDEAKVGSIWRESEGYVAQVNRVAERQVFQQDLGLEEEGRPVRGLPLVHMALLVVLLAALIFALIYLGGDEGGEEKITADTPSEVKEIVLPIPPLNKLPASSASESSVTVENNSKESVNEPLAKSSETPKIEKEMGSAGSVVKEVAKTDQVDTIKSVDQKAVASSETAITEPQQKAAADVVAKQNPKESLEKALRQELQKEAVTLNAEEKNKVSPNKASLTEGEKWLMALSDNRYVLQVIAAGQKESVKKFVASQPNKNILRLITVGRGGKPWYVVVVGNYSDSDSARKAIQSLPQDQVNGGPWPRKVSTLKREIETFRDN